MGNSSGEAILSIDQGTTSSRAIVFNLGGQILGQHQLEFKQHFPQDGWVEHDPEEIWDTTLSTCREAIKEAGLKPAEINAIGITNQRETTVIWDRESGKPIHNAIVWQDRRTASLCQSLKEQGLEGKVQEKTGLLLDPYFAGTKVRWLLDNVEGARALANEGKLAFGTIDSFLLWRLTGGKVHKTEATNASRTLLFNIHTQSWDHELLDLLEVPETLLPSVEDCCSDFGTVEADLLGAEIPIAGIAGDQHAALIGQACFKAGMAKSTYGTGCFFMMNTGERAVPSTNRLLTTVGYRIKGKTTYALEGSIFMAGATVQWLRDGLKVIESAVESQAIAEKVGYQSSVYLVPAFTGLGAPYWDADARGAIVGLTRDSGPDDIVTAGLQSVVYQTADLINAMINDGAASSNTLRVDGGMVVNDWVIQYLADILNTPVDRPVMTESTALGAAYLAGLQAGLYKDFQEIESYWQCERRFEPALEDKQREQLYQGWQTAVGRIKSSQ